MRLTSTGLNLSPVCLKLAEIKPIDWVIARVRALSRIRKNTTNMYGECMHPTGSERAANGAHRKRRAIIGRMTDGAIQIIVNMLGNGV